MSVLAKRSLRVAKRLLLASAASHSLIAWAGVAFGTDFIHEGVQDGRVRQLVLAYVQDVIASLGPGPLDLAALPGGVPA